MGNKQSYDLAQAQARNNDNRLPEEVVSQQDEFCRPVSMASTSSMRKPSKPKAKRAKDIDKENVSLDSSREEFSSPIEDHNGQREVAIDVPEEPSRPPSIAHSSIIKKEIEEQKREIILTEPLLADTPQSNLNNVPPVEEEVLVRACELPKTELSGQNIAVEEVKMADYKTEKERAKHVAEEAVKQVEKRNSLVTEEAVAKRNSRDRSHSHSSSIHIVSASTQNAELEKEDLERLHKAVEVENVPLEQGGSRRVEQAEIDEVTKQLDDAISEDFATQEDSVVVLEESTVEEFATVSLALEEDISAIETTRNRRELLKLHYTQPLDAKALDAAPSQTHYIKLK